MRAFIGHNLKLLFSAGTITFIIGYNGFAWFLSSPPLDPFSVHNTGQLLIQYDRIIYSLGFFGFLHIILTHFRIQIQTANLDAVRTRLTLNGIFNGLLLSYFIFFLIGFLLSSYIIAIFQQQMQSSQSIDYVRLLYRALCGLFGNTLFWTLSALCLIRFFREEFTVLVVMVVVYIGTHVIWRVSGGFLFDPWWLYHVIDEQKPDIVNVSVIFLLWFVANLVIYFKASQIFRTIFGLSRPDNLTTGLFETICTYIGAELSAHHVKMLRFSVQRTRYFFSILALVVILVMMKSPAVNLNRLFYIYLGGFLPVFFSFNQYLLIKVDQVAGMMHNNFLRKTAYSRIVLNRWALGLIPQLVINLIILFTLKQFGYNLNRGVLIYIPMLHIFFSLLSLSLNIIFSQGGVVNIMIAGFAYILLREDVHQSLLQNHWLGVLNIFKPFLSNNPTVSIWQEGFLSASILIVCMFTVRVINRFKYSELAANH